MKLSENALNVLKNFSGINSGVVLNPGTMQRTMSVDKAILVEATLPDDIPSQFGIYDLSQFLGNITTLSNPELTFDEKSVMMDDGQIKLTYYSCSPNLINTPPDKKLEMKTQVAEFSLSNAALQKLLRVAAMNNLPMLTVIGENGKLSLKTHENSDTSNIARMDLADYDGEDFSVMFKTEHLKMIPDDYTVQIGPFAIFTNKDTSLKYFIAIQSK
jgi:hypothetical protein